MLLSLLLFLRLEEDPAVVQWQVLQILRHPPPDKYPRESGFNSFLKFFLHLHLHVRILTGLQGIEESAPPRLRRSFWGTTVAVMKVVLLGEFSGEFPEPHISPDFLTM